MLELGERADAPIAGGDGGDGGAGEPFDALARAAREVVLIHEQGVVRAINDAFTRVLGFTRADIIDKNGLAIFVSPESHTVVRATMLAGGSSRPEDVVVTTKTGERRICQYVSEPVTYQGRPMRVVAMTDLTERVLLEERERRNAKLLSAIARATLGTTGQTFFDALARTLAEALGTDYAFVAELHDGGARARTLAAWGLGAPLAPFEMGLEGTPCAGVLRGSSCVFPDGVQARFPSDHLLCQLGVDSYVGIPILGESGQPEGILVALHRGPLPADAPYDGVRVTLELFAARAAAELERTRALHALEAARAELERRVTERTAELTAANQELEAFAYSVSHDLRAPLRHITGFAELVARAAAERLDATAQRHLDIVRRSAQRMTGLIDDLLSFSRTGRSTLRPMRVDMGELVAEVVREHAPPAGERAVEWELGPLPEVHGDRPLLAQVIANLVDNALKYSRGRTPARIAISATRDGGEHVFRVADNGVGFDPRYAAQLFGVFRRLHRADEFEGNGIGLATVRRVITRHGGRVWAEAQPDAGATFCFTLPARSAP
jgi:PAS domain S-box-containing protein